ncbi:type IV secretory system conjugative DNA transfer family protein [Methylomagnum ishizawai]|uniref:type IV secretory system conjugative DNA transfer family protein n=1 Tax=Methylomagnum ishizawai TaxID=1760988 RepID=UPI001C7F9695|nr:type IV secretory system conjugative DNA transfer family protein [Methylomagnum ishizawai]
MKRAGLLQGQGTLYFGQSPSKYDLSLPGDGHSILIGGAGSGKSAEFLLPNLLKLGLDSAALVLDCKGELSAVTMASHAPRNIQAYYINPYGLHTGNPWFIPQHRLFPLDYIDPDSPTFTADIRMTMEALIPIQSGTKDDYWEERARLWCAALMKFLAVSFGHVDILEFYRLLNIIKGDFGKFEQIARDYIIPLGMDDVTSVVQDILYERREAGRTYAGVISNIFKNIAWLDDPSLQACFSSQDFSMKILTEPRHRVFIILPAEYMGIYKSFLRLLILAGMIYKQRAPQAGRVLFALDEAGQLGYSESIERAYTYGRGAGIRMLAIFQSLGQLSGYPANGQNVMASASLRLFMGTRDYPTAELVSKSLGERTYEYIDPKHQAMARQQKAQALLSMLQSNQDPFAAAVAAVHASRSATLGDRMSRALLAPDEVLNLPQNQLIALTSGMNCPPILAGKVPYWLREDMAGLFLPNPYHPPYDSITVPLGRMKTAQKRVICERVPERLQHYPQYQQGYLSRLS